MSGQQSMRTPQWLFDLLDRKYGPFKLDAAATPHNALCKRFYTEDDSGLENGWLDPTFCNPPFKDFGLWLEHACNQLFIYGRRSVLIGPVGCSQKWFHEQAIHTHILAPNRRINFDLPDGTPTRGADRDTMIYTIGYEEEKSQLEFSVAPINVNVGSSK